MSIELHHEHDNVFRLDLSGLLRQQEFERSQQQVLGEALRGGPVRLLFVLQDFDGWDSGDDWRDLSFYVKHGSAIERIAIVGPERWRDLTLMFAAADMRQAPVEFFPTGEIAEARTWLSQ
jgi:hypothetical protein